MLSGLNQYLMNNDPCSLRREDLDTSQVYCFLTSQANHKPNENRFPYINFTTSLQQSSYMEWTLQYVGPTPCERTVVNLL
jgi:hypothetical protein